MALPLNFLEAAFWVEWKPFDNLFGKNSLSKFFKTFSILEGARASEANICGFYSAVQKRFELLGAFRNEMF